MWTRSKLTCPVGNKQKSKVIENTELWQVFFEHEGLLFTVMKPLCFSRGPRMVELCYLIPSCFTQLRSPKAIKKVMCPCSYHSQALSPHCTDFRKSLWQHDEELCPSLFLPLSDRETLLKLQAPVPYFINNTMVLCLHSFSTAFIVIRLLGTMSVFNSKNLYHREKNVKAQA